MSAKLTTLEAPFLLIASPQLNDENFWRAVILVVDLNDEGAMGFIINRPSELPLAAILKAEHLDVPNNVPTWNGGPVRTELGLILTSHTDMPNDPDDVIHSDFVITSSEYSLARLIEHAEQYNAANTLDANEVRYPHRFVVGYTGWDAAQLENEIKEGSWLTLDYDRHLVFSTPWAQIWDQAIASLGIDPTQLSGLQTSSKHLH